MIMLAWTSRQENSNHGSMPGNGLRVIYSEAYHIRFTRPSCNRPAPNGRNRGNEIHELESCHLPQPTTQRESESRYLDFYGLLDCHALGQIPRLVHIAPANDRDVISEQLKRNDCEQRKQSFHRLRQINYVVGFLFDLFVA